MRGPGHNERLCPSGGRAVVGRGSSLIRLMKIGFGPWGRPLTRATLVCAAAAVLYGCAAKEVKKETFVPAPPTSMVELVDERPEALPHVEEKVEQSGPVDLYSLSVREVEVREVLFALAIQSGFGIVIDPQVDGKVSAELKDVTLEDGLRYILRPLHIDFRIEGRSILVHKPRIETMIFHVDYVNTSRTGSSQVTASTTTQSGGGRSGSGGGSGGGGSMGGQGGRGGSSGGMSSISSKEENDLWKEIEEGIKEILSDKGKLVVNSMTGTVLISDYPERIEGAGLYLEELEGIAKRQIMIQAKILEVELSDDYQAGIDWSMAIESSTASHLSGALDSSAFMDGAAIGQALSPGNGIFQLGLASDRLSLLMDLFSTQGNVNILSTPEISTLNNQRAIIKVAREDVYFEVTIETDLTTGLRTETANARSITEGIVLDVIPQISADGEIIMNIHPSITEKVGEAVSRFGDTAPIIDVREIDTVVKVKDNATIVIAGLMQDQKKERITKVPWLGDVPYLGTLFRQTKQESKKVELVILLTPKVITPYNGNAITQARLERLGRLRQGFHFGGNSWEHGTEGGMPKRSAESGGE